MQTPLVGICSRPFPVAIHSSHLLSPLLKEKQKAPVLLSLVLAKHCSLRLRLFLFSYKKRNGKKKGRVAKAREGGGGDLFQYSRNIPCVTGFLKKSSRWARSLVTWSRSSHIPPQTGRGSGGSRRCLWHVSCVLTHSKTSTKEEGCLHLLWTHQMRPPKSDSRTQCGCRCSG